MVFAVLHSNWSCLGYNLGYPLGFVVSWITIEVGHMDFATIMATTGQVIQALATTGQVIQAMAYRATAITTDQMT